MNKAVEYAFNFESEFQNQHQTAQLEIQQVLDDSYRFKTKTLLTSVSLKKVENKLDELKKERERYRSLIVHYDFFKLTDNSDWKKVESDLRYRALELQEAMDKRDAQNEIKRQMREERTRLGELERQQIEAEKRETELEERKTAIQHALLEASEEHRKELEATRKLLEDEIEEVHKQYERAKSMAQMTRQGHVYIISNIGSFGENVFKIGMTRRLEPLDRIYELSSASVPFEFDVHAMISCDDAPALESALHAELSDNRINKVNVRKEFFRTDIQKIIDVVKQHHGEVEYVANPAALQYYKSLEAEELREKETVVA
ncbi:GIY-YIG nuclease family protein [Pseudomonas graminis]